MTPGDEWDILEAPEGDEPEAVEEGRPAKIVIEVTGDDIVSQAVLLTDGETTALQLQGVVQDTAGVRITTVPVTIRARLS